MTPICLLVSSLSPYPTPTALSCIPVAPQPHSHITQFMSCSEGRLEPIILHNSTAPSWVTHSAHIGHAQSVTCRDPAQVLWREIMEDA